MPRYDFENEQGKVEEHIVSLADLEEYTEWMARLGWRRRLNVPYAIIVTPTYSEAVEESTRMADEGKLAL